MKHGVGVRRVVSHPWRNCKVIAVEGWMEGWMHSVGLAITLGLSITAREGFSRHRAGGGKIQSRRKAGQANTSLLKDRTRVCYGNFFRFYF